MANKNDEQWAKNFFLPVRTKNPRVLLFEDEKKHKLTSKAAFLTMNPQNLLNMQQAENLFPNGDNKENINPTAVSQPMARTQYVTGMSRTLSIVGLVRDRSIIRFIREKEFCRLRVRITLLVRFMEHSPQPGPLVIEGYHQLYYGDDYDEEELEEWLIIMRHTYCAPMTHEEYRRMRTARLVMMKTMLREIPGVCTWAHPSLWYTFETMGHLLDSLTTWPQALGGQMSSVNDFFNNPQWLPIV